ncbi:hypothetical protein XELAEV_18030334mg [Xenopus laevis]|uniref:Uncharacterized protein n=1 Tax=Xenopus laevis TaxID=8355 RepID=A0A974CTJ6_XENLA|nr:hypothetical protein XELAEV_18030334mg [Xenopus laevis]
MCEPQALESGGGVPNSLTPSSVSSLQLAWESHIKGDARQALVIAVTYLLGLEQRYLSPIPPFSFVSVVGRDVQHRNLV